MKVTAIANSDPASRGSALGRTPPAIALMGRIVGGMTALAMALAALGLLASLVMIAYGVVMRYGFNSPPVWVDDLVGFILVGIVMLAAAATLRRGEHISVDILTDRLSPSGKRWAQGWAMASVIVAAAMLVVNGWETAMSSKALGIMTSGQVEIPVYLLQMLLPLGGVAMLLVAVETLVRLVAGAPSLAIGPHLGEDAE